MYKKVMSLLLSVVIVLSTLPVMPAVIAAEYDYPVLFEMPLVGSALPSGAGTTNYSYTGNNYQQFRWYCDYPYWGGTPGNFTADFTPGLTYSDSSNNASMVRDMRYVVLEFTTAPANGAEFYFAINTTGAANVTNQVINASKVTATGDGQSTRLVFDVTDYDNRIAWITNNGGYRCWVVAPAAANLHSTISRIYLASSRTEISTPTNVAFSDLSANGDANTITTELTFTLNPVVPDFTAADIDVTGVTDKGELRVSGATYTLPVTVPAGGTATVTPAKEGFVFTPANLSTTVFYKEAVAQKYGWVRTIKTPVAGQYPVSFYRNTIKDINTTASSGMTQTLSWSPDIDDQGFKTNIVYTAVLEIEPTNWTNAGFPGTTASFSENALTWENLNNLPTEGVASVRSEYYSGAASGNYYSRPSDLNTTNPTGANLRVFIEFEPTASVKSEPEILFFDDFSGEQRTGTAAVNGTTTNFIRGTQQQRQDWGAYWNYNYSNIKTDYRDPSNKVLELGWALNDYQTVVNGTGSSYNWLVEEAPARSAVPLTTLGLKNTAGNDVLEILLDVAIYDAIWMGKDYITTTFASTDAAWKALTLEQRIASWSSLTEEARLEIWNAYWPETWTDGREYLRRNSVLAGCWDTRGGSGVDPFQNAYGYYEVSMRMTPVNSLWTAFWLNGESSGAGSGGTADNTVTEERVVSSNPMLSTMTAANRLSAIRRQSSWHGAEIDVIENCEPVLDRGYSSSLHYGGYGGYGNGRQHQEVWMPYDTSPEEMQTAYDLNIYDGEFHTFALEWSPTNCKFYVDDVLTADVQDITTHWPFFVQAKDQIQQLPYLDGKLGIPQNPNMMRLSVEGAYWSGHGVEYKYYPYDCGLGIREDRTLPVLSTGTMENGGAAVVNYVLVTNGPKPAKAVAQKYGWVRTIKTPVAGQYPVSFYRNTIKDINLTASSGMTQTLSWSPDIDDQGFRTNTVYTAVLEIEPTNWNTAGFPGTTASFSENALTWENLNNLPTQGVASVRSEYFSGSASGNYYSRPSALNTTSPTGANLRVFIEFEPTASVKSEPEILFFDDFSSEQRTGAAAVNGTTTNFIRGTQQQRQDWGAYWNNNYSNIKTDYRDSTNKVLELGWALNDYQTVVNGTGSSYSWVVEEAPARPAVPLTALGLKNAAENDVLEILLDVAINDKIWMGKDYLTTTFATTDEAWNALTLTQKLAAWNTLSDEARLEIWDAYWPATWTDGREYLRRNSVLAGCWDTRGGSGVDPFQNAYGYYEVSMRMTPVNSLWTAFWLNGESSGAGSGGTADNTVTADRVVSSNPLLPSMTEANRLSAIRRQSSWHGSEIDVVENCEPVLDRGYSSSFHYGGYGGYGNGRQHQEVWMPYDTSPEEIQTAHELNIYDGEFHTFALEWSPTNCKFYVDDVLTADAQDITTHWPFFVQAKDQVQQLPYLDGKLGIPQNPNMMRLSVEGAYWSGHGVEYKYYPYDCGLGIREDRTLPVLSTGTMENGGAALVNYVLVTNGPKPAVQETGLKVTVDNSTKELAVLARLGTNVINATVQGEDNEVLPATSLTYTWRLSESADSIVNPIAGNGTLAQNNSRYTISPSDIGGYLWLDVTHEASGLSKSVYVGYIKYFGEIRPINSPVAGHFPSSLLVYEWRNNGTGNNYNNGYLQTLTWSPFVERYHLPDTVYTVTLALQTGGRWSNEYTSSTPASFETNNIKPEHFKNMPKVGEDGVTAITYDYSGSAMNIHISYAATEATIKEPDLIFFDNFEGDVNPHDRPNGLTTQFIRGPEIIRQEMSHWRNDMSGIVERDGEKYLWLGYKIDSSLAPSSATTQQRDNWIRAGGVRTRGQGGSGNLSADEITFENAYGYYEAKIKFPMVTKVWGAFWLMSVTQGYSADYGSARGSEIDIYETCDAYQTSHVGNSALHFAGYGSNHRELSFADNKRFQANGTSLFDGNWHTYALEWTATDYVFYVDDIPWARYSDQTSFYAPNSLYQDLIAPYMIEYDKGFINQNPNYMKLTVEASDWPSGSFPVNPSSGEMLVDYVKVWNGPKPDVQLKDAAITDLTANGTANSASTTTLAMTLDRVVSDLTHNDIVVTGARKGVLTRSSATSTTYNLAISDIEVSQGEQVTVTILPKHGWNFTTATGSVAVNVAPSAPTPPRGYDYPVSFQLPIAPATVPSASGGTETANYVFDSDARWYWENVRSGSWRSNWRLPNPGAENYTVGLTRGTSGILARAQYIVLEFENAPAAGTDIQFALQTSNSGWGTGKVPPDDRRIGVKGDGVTKKFSIPIAAAPDRHYAIGQSIAYGGTNYTDYQGFRIFTFFPSGSVLTNAYLANSRTEILPVVNISVSPAIKQLVSGMAANLVVHVSAEDVADDDIIINAFGVNAPVMNGNATIKLASGVVPSVDTDTDFPVTAFIDDVNVATSTIKVTPYNNNIWQASLVEGADSKASIQFHASIALAATAGVTVKGSAVAFTLDGSSLLLDVSYESIAVGDIVIAKGIKFPALFPSYSFTFTVGK